jgi:hypothetical protein
MKPTYFLKSLDAWTWSSFKIFNVIKINKTPDFLDRIGPPLHAKVRRLGEERVSSYLAQIIGLITSV